MIALAGLDLWPDNPKLIELVLRITEIRIQLQPEARPRVFHPAFDISPRVLLYGFRREEVGENGGVTSSKVRIVSVDGQIRLLEDGEHIELGGVRCRMDKM